MVQFFVWLVLTVVSYFLAPRPKSTAPNAATLDDFQVPTAEDGRAISWLFGSRDITAPDTEWYGDLNVTAVTKDTGGK